MPALLWEALTPDRGKRIVIMLPSLSHVFSLLLFIYPNSSFQVITTPPSVRPLAGGNKSK